MELMFGRSMKEEAPALFRVRVERKAAIYTRSYGVGDYHGQIRPRIEYAGPYTTFAAAKGVATGARPRRPDDGAASDSFERVLYENTFVTIERTDALWDTVFTYE